MDYKLARGRAAWCACPAARTFAGLLTRETSANPSGWAHGGSDRSRGNSWKCLRRMPGPAGGLLETVASSLRHGWLRRNALSPLGVRLSGAPGTPLFTGCSLANRALVGKLLWNGIVAVPKVFGTGC